MDSFTAFFPFTARTTTSSRRFTQSCRAITGKGTAKFEVPYVKMGNQKDPSNFILKVKPLVNVELELSGEVKTPK